MDIVLDKSDDYTIYIAFVILKILPMELLF